MAALDARSRVRGRGSTAKSEARKKANALNGSRGGRQNGANGYFSGDMSPKATTCGRRLAELSLKLGRLVIEVEGTFRAVALKQRVRFQPLDVAAKGRSEGAVVRYAKYRTAGTVGEALRLGAVPDDLYFDLKHHFLEFVPKLVAKQARGPLPQSLWPSGIRPVKLARPWWLPRDWAHGLKTTCKTFLRVYIAPSGKTYYHRATIEKIVQQQLGGVDGAREWAQKCIDKGTDWQRKPIKHVADGKLFAHLTKAERQHLAPVDDLHFAVISARRAGDAQGIRGLVRVQGHLLAAGVSPRWYVDEASVEDYRRLGLDAVVGGKLTPSRNMALRDAEEQKKACVQISDDIAGWQYTPGEIGPGLVGGQKLQAANVIAQNQRLEISPVAAARFLLAKMRGCEGEEQPRLGGVYLTGNAAQGMLVEAFSRNAFILGDFFVHDRSPCRFDESITLKEDYDFTCSHLSEHGSVMRCNRMVVHAAHETNAGGACDVRDDKGKLERDNIAILTRKWPGVFKPHPTRGDTQVILKWPKRARKELTS
eukprot:TRINITY_DN21604_c0_g1_i2.p1 TRINITY_DN21604_c0_g1~~TRINITY_DN21604_c0_g1_i2.p1  ORF type:complete len:546 (+),score=112.83 TRINITY_DN21604_c0_g1_i2:32-1639(+)